MLHFLALAVCQHAPATVAQRISLRPPNVIVVVLDDVGLDQLDVYGGTPAWGESRARTPVIDQLRASGVLFEHAYSAPLCSPSRAMLLTGRHGFRTGMLNLAEETGPVPREPCSMDPTIAARLPTLTVSCPSRRPFHR